MTSKLVVPKMEYIRIEGMKAIIDRLVIAQAAFFFRANLSQEVDYLQVKEEMFGDKSARELYEEIKNHSSV